MIITLTYTDNVDNNAPAGFKTCAQRVADFLQTKYRANVTVPILIDFFNLGGPAAQTTTDQVLTLTYAQLKAALAANARSPESIAAVNSLPSSDPSGEILGLTKPHAFALGLAADAGFSVCSFTSTGTWTTDNSGGVPAGTRDLEGTMFHELTEVMGRIRDGNISAFYAPLDLFAFTSAGVRVPNVRGGYFSVDGGVTNLSTPNVFASSGDAGDWSGAAIDACNTNLTTGVIMPFSTYDQLTLDALGWQAAPPFVMRLTWS